MCRVHKPKRGWYVRLCARRSPLRLHMPVPTSFRLQGGHWRGEADQARIREMRRVQEQQAA